MEQTRFTILQINVTMLQFIIYLETIYVRVSDPIYNINNLLRIHLTRSRLRLFV